MNTPDSRVELRFDLARSWSLPAGVRDRLGAPARVREPAGFSEFVAARSPALLRAAWLLTGDDGAAQDLVQAALIRTWSR